MIIHNRDSRLSLGEILKMVARMTKNTVPIQIGGRNTSALVDPGASVSIINKDFLGKTSYANDELLPPEFNSVKGASGRLLPVIGKLNAEIFINGQSYPFMVHVVDGLHHAFILGVDFYVLMIQCSGFRRKILCLFQMLRVKLMYVSFQQKMGMLGQNVLLQFLRDVR